MNKVIKRNAVLVQRLVRKICHRCRQPYNPLPQEIAVLQFSEKETRNLTLFKGAGYPKCLGTGYFRRIGIFEIMPVSDEIRRLIHSNAGAQEIKKTALKEWKGDRGRI